MHDLDGIFPALAAKKNIEGFWPGLPRGKFSGGFAACIKFSGSAANGGSFRVCHNGRAMA